MICTYTLNDIILDAESPDEVKALICLYRAINDNVALKMSLNEGELWRLIITRSDDSYVE